MSLTPKMLHASTIESDSPGLCHYDSPMADTAEPRSGLVGQERGQQRPAARSAVPAAQPLAGEVLGAVRARHSEAVEFLRKLVLVETPTLEPQTQAVALQQLDEGLAAAGLRCRRHSGYTSGGMLLASWPRQRRSSLQLLIGHCDTVWPLGTLDSMPVEIDGSRMRGPGVYDMKCGVTQTVFALRALRDCGLEPEVKPVVFINSDEEIGSHDSEKYIRWLAGAANRVFVMEPSLTPAGWLKTARKGVRQYRIKVTGRAAHAGLNPEEGVSAILEMSRLVEALFALNDVQRGVSVNVGIISGGSRSNVIAAECVADVDVRVPTADDAARVDAAIRGLKASNPEAIVCASLTQGRLPMEQSAAGKTLWEAACGHAESLGFALEQGRAGGGSDGNITNLYAPTLDGLGAVGDGAHAAHEYVDLDRMVERTALLALLLLEPPLS